MFWRTILSLPLRQEVMAADSSKTMLYNYDYMVSKANHDINLHHHDNLNQYLLECDLLSLFPLANSTMKNAKNKYTLHIHLKFQKCSQNLL